MLAGGLIGTTIAGLMGLSPRPAQAEAESAANDNEQSISGGAFGISLRPGGDFIPKLKSIATDAEGRFEHDGLLAGVAYDVMSESTQVGFKTLANNLTVNPGETVELGTIDVASDERPEPVRRRSATPVSVEMSDNSGEEHTGSCGPGHHVTTVRRQGRRSERQARRKRPSSISFSTYHSRPACPPTWKPLATLTPLELFRFTASPTDFGIHTTTREFGYGTLVAVKEGFGFAGRQPGCTEKVARGSARCARPFARIAEKFLQQIKQMLSGVGEPLKLVADDEPIRGPHR